MRRTLLFTALVLVAGTVFASEKATDAEVKVPTIQVVKDLDELRKQPVIDLGALGQVRLGLEATEAPLYSGIVVYALVENTSTKKLVGSDSLGPVQVSLEWDDDHERYKDVCYSIFQDKDARGRTYLYARVMAISKVGTALIAVRNGGIELLAQAHITGTNKKFHPWSPFSLAKSQETPSNMQTADTKDVAFPALSNSSDGVALPVTFNTVGFAITPETPLTLPAISHPEEKVVLSLKGQTLSIKLDGKYHIKRPEDVLLARWWVNDKPFIPPPANPESCEIADTERMWETDRLLVKLELDSKKLGAQSGDKIALQILHCPQGWLDVIPEMLKQQAEGNDDRPQFSISNKIEFTAP